jgi:hypothetical protein
MPAKAHVIKDLTGTNQSDVKVLMAYFGKQEGQTVSEFMAEVKELTPDGKSELAIGAAHELGWSVEV